MSEARDIRRGDICYYDFGENKGSIQCGNRPVLVVQADNFNRNAPTVIVAAITTVIKKQYMASHIILPDDTGLGRPSMVMLEQIRTVNKEDLGNHVGSLRDDRTWKQVNNGIVRSVVLQDRKHRQYPLPVPEVCKGLHGLPRLHCKTAGSVRQNQGQLHQVR